MISAEQIREILSLYRRHGWQLRRVLLTPPLQEALALDNQTLFGTTEISKAEIDACWFSRPSQADREAWELRLLSDAPFALLEIFESDDDEEIREEARAEIERQLKKTAGKQINRRQ